MNKLLPIVLLVFLIFLTDNTNGIRCYNCLSACPDPFNKTNPDVLPLESTTGWCMKFKASEKHQSVVIHSSDTIGLCAENTCKSIEHNGFKGIGCCCNTDLCNNSNTIAKSLSSFIGLALIAEMNVILNY